MKGRSYSFPLFVHFFGPDGSGKSVQAEILTTILTERGFRATKVWLRAHHTLAFLMWNLLVRFGFCRTVLNSSGAVTRIPAVDRGKSLKGFWAFVEFVSVLPLVLRVKVSILKGYSVIAERYLLDTIAAIAYTINDIDFMNGLIAGLLIHLLPKDTIFIFLDSNYETLLQRRMCEHRSFESRGFVEFQRYIYRKLARSFGALTIDTSAFSIDETSERIKQLLAVT